MPMMERDTARGVSAERADDKVIPDAIASRLIGPSIKPPRVPRVRLSPAAMLRFLESREGLAAVPSHTRHQQIKALRARRRRIVEMACTSAWVDAVWVRSEPYMPAAPCRCKVCKGLRRYPAIFLHHGISWECGIAAYIDNRQGVMDDNPEHILDRETLEELQGQRSSVWHMPSKRRGRTRRKIGEDGNANGSWDNAVRAMEDA